MVLPKVDIKITCIKDHDCGFFIQYIGYVIFHEFIFVKPFNYFIDLVFFLNKELLIVINELALVHPVVNELQ